MVKLFKKWYEKLFKSAEDQDHKRKVEYYNTYNYKTNKPTKNNQIKQKQS